MIFYGQNIEVQSNNRPLKNNKVCIKARSTQSSLLFKGLVTEHTTVKWTIAIGRKEHLVFPNCYSSTVSYVEGGRKKSELHNRSRETPLPIYVGLKLNAKP